MIKLLWSSLAVIIFEWGTFLRRLDNFLMDLYIDKKNVASIVELLMERHMKMLEKVCHYLGDLVDVIRFGDDLGMDSGIDIINPVQTNCLNMEADRLKNEFGKDVVFWGGS